MIQLFSDVIAYAKEATLLRPNCGPCWSSGKRDLGSGEVCRYLLSEPCYHMDFSPVYLHLIFNHRELDISRSRDTGHPLTFKKTLIDNYLNRNNIAEVVPHLSKINNLIDFALNFEINGNILRLRINPNKIIVITYPKIRLVKKIPKNIKNTVTISILNMLLGQKITLMKLLILMMLLKDLKIFM